MLTRCTFNGQQCCHQFVIDEFDNAMRLAFNNGTIPFTRSFADAQKAVDEMRKDATSMHYVYVTGFTKTNLKCTFSISRNTDLKY